MAIRQGIIDTSEWEICCAGQDIPDIVFSDGTRPVHSGLMSWQEYRDFVSEVDLALSLMYTPHPSYPPFDVAVSGGVVVTNKCMNKQYFSECKNVLMGDLEPNSFRETMRQGVALAGFGLYILIRPGIIEVFLTTVFAIIIIVDGILKLQYALDFRKLDAGGWWIEAVCAAVMIILGIVVLFNPFATVAAVMLFIGVVFVFEGAWDLASILYISKIAKEFNK